MLDSDETSSMRTFSTHTDHLRGHRPRAVVLAVSGPTGVDDAAELLHGLPSLSCPVIVCPDASVRDDLVEAVPDLPMPSCTEGLALTDAPVWMLPEATITTVHLDRWVTEPSDADFDAQIGRLVSSLKSSYRSRVFMICTATTLETNPFVQLLAQRGAPLVETQDRPGRSLADHAPVPEILTHLASAVGIIEKASA